MRIFVLSDLHADFAENRHWLHQLSSQDFQHDCLVVAGDVSHRLDVTASTFQLLNDRFARVCFVAGNHDLWLRDNDCADSREKLDQLLRLCAELHVCTDPVKIGAGDACPVWLVPLDAWYDRPEDSADSLYVAKIGEHANLRWWADNRAIRWPDTGEFMCPAEWMLARNALALDRHYDAPVISFSHVLPRAEAMFPTPAELAAWGPDVQDPTPRFNFSRVAGTRALDRQIRRLGARLHLYGHQHRNRMLTVEDITYLSHCLGYPRERAIGRLWGIEEGPRLIWDTAQGTLLHNQTALPPISRPARFRS